MKRVALEISEVELDEKALELFHTPFNELSDAQRELIYEFCRIESGETGEEPGLTFASKKEAAEGVKCPQCGEDIWDYAKGHKLNKCWNCMTAFDSPEAEASSKIRCNNCQMEFDSDEDLALIDSGGYIFKGCPNCNTDSYLMDVGGNLPPVASLKTEAGLTQQVKHLRKKLKEMDTEKVDYSEASSMIDLLEKLEVRLEKYQADRKKRKEEREKAGQPPEPEEESLDLESKLDAAAIPNPDGEFVQKPIESIQTADEARQIAVDWQVWQSEQNLSYGEMAEWDAYFGQLASKFPELADEFVQNGIIGGMSQASLESEAIHNTDDMAHRDPEETDLDPHNPGSTSPHSTDPGVVQMTAADEEGTLLAVWEVDKMVTDFNEESQDWSGQTRDFGIIDKGNMEVTSIEEAVTHVQEQLGLSYPFEKFDEEPSDGSKRYSTNRQENGDGLQDEAGKYLADYNLYIRLYKSVDSLLKTKADGETQTTAPKQPSPTNAPVPTSPSVNPPDTDPKTQDMARRQIMLVQQLDDIKKKVLDYQKTLMQEIAPIQVLIEQEAPELMAAIGRINDMVLNIDGWIVKINSKEGYPTLDNAKFQEEMMKYLERYHKAAFDYIGKMKESKDMMREVKPMYPYMSVEKEKQKPAPKKKSDLHSIAGFWEKLKSWFQRFVDPAVQELDESTKAIDDLFAMAGAQ